MATTLGESKKEKSAVDLLKMISENDNYTAQQWNDHQLYLQPIEKLEVQRSSSISKLQPIKAQKKPYAIFKKRTQRKLHLRIQQYEPDLTNYKSFSLSRLQKQQVPDLTAQNNEKNSQDQKNISKKNLKLNQTNQIKQKRMYQTISGHLKPSGSDGYMLKINKFVSPQQIHQSNQKAQIYDEGSQHGSMVNQQFKSKVRWKISKKIAYRKQSIEADKMKNKKGQIINQIQVQPPQKIQNNAQGETSARKMLRNLLDSNRYRKRRSVASLLRSLFDSQAQSPRDERSTNLTIKSARYISLTSDNTKLIR